MRSRSSTLLALAGAAALLAPAGLARAELVYATTLTGTLVSFDSANPGTILGGFAIQGLASNETVRGIDFRPATGQLVAVGSFGNLYTLNPSTGVATALSTLSIPLNGDSYGVDFNPTVDRLRIVSGSDQNLRVNVDTGETFNDGTLAFVSGDANFGANPNVVHAAYTNNFAGATSTTLYVLDTGLDVLAIQNPANNGTLLTVGSVGADLTTMGGFDISGVTGAAFAAVRGIEPDRSTFWSINLTTGQGTQIGEVGGGLILTGIAVVPAPGAGGLLALCALGATRRRR